MSSARPPSPPLPDRRARGSARERLLSTARTLFLKEGIRATGIDRVIAESSIAKATLYNHFATKEDLVVAVLEAHLADWQEQVRATADADAGAEPSVHIARLFDALAATVHTGEFRGCPFSNALTELPGSRSVRAVAERYRTQQLDHVSGLVGREPTDKTVRAVVLLLEGATNVTKTTNSPDEILLARDVAIGLVTASATPGRSQARTQDR
jgi:AcrR family transcriptional regulator